MIDHPEKIGVGTWQSSGQCIDGVGKLGAAWYYTWDAWGLTGNAKAEFVPMIWGGNTLNASNLARATARPRTSSSRSTSRTDPTSRISRWHRRSAGGRRWRRSASGLARPPSPPVRRSGTILGCTGSWKARSSAATTSTSSTCTTMPQRTPGAFKTFLTSLHEEYNMPIWVTEWSLVGLDTWTTSQSEFTPNQIAQF